MRFAEATGRTGRWLLLALAGLLGACGGGSSSTTTTICRDASVCVAHEAVQAGPTGSNTTEILIDSGPAGAFALGVTNVPYVTVRVCTPGSSTQCVTIDHVLLDTGSYGLRVLKSKVEGLALAAVPVAADVASATPAGNAFECYAFVLGAMWGPLAKADVQIGGELATDLTVQLIDDGGAPAVPPNCQNAAQGTLLNSVTSLQANGILGVGVVGVDCGLSCLTNTYPGGYVVYYSCPAGSSACAPAGLPTSAQVQNPVVKFAVNNNGTMIVMPALPELGAMTARGRLVFGIGTQTNNQIPLDATIYQVSTNPASVDYLYLGLQVGALSYPLSYIDSGTNALFFDEPGLSRVCNVSAGQQGQWYCPAATSRRTATLTDAAGVRGSFDLKIAAADALFSTGATAFSDLAGSAGQGTETLALGLPFFYGRAVFTSIWGQRLATNGPWYAF